MRVVGLRDTEYFVGISVELIFCLNQNWIINIIDEMCKLNFKTSVHFNIELIVLVGETITDRTRELDVHGTFFARIKHTLSNLKKCI